MDESIARAELEIRTHDERGEVAQYGFVTGGVLTDVYENAVCHSNFSSENDTQRRADVFYNVTQHREEPGTEAAYAFYAWLFGPWSPYQAILGSYVNDPQDVVDSGYILTDFGDAPANLLYNLVIASRFPTEQIDHLENWWVRVQAGIHPGLAYWASYTFGRRNPNENHQSFDWLRVDDDYVRRLCRGDPTQLSGKYSSKGLCTPCNSVWASPELHTRVGSSGNVWVSDNPIAWKWPHLYPGTVGALGTFKTHEIAIECLLKEQVRLGL